MTTHFTEWSKFVTQQSQKQQEYSECSLITETDLEKIKSKFCLQIQIIDIVYNPLYTNSFKSWNGKARIRPGRYDGNVGYKYNENVQRRSSCESNYCWSAFDVIKYKTKSIDSIQVFSNRIIALNLLKSKITQFVFMKYLSKKNVTSSNSYE